MGRAFINSILVTIPAVILPILFAAFAAYAFAWLHFPMRTWIFALLVGLQVIPLQMTLIPISRLYAQLGLNGTYAGVWLFHMGFGLPYAIYLMRNFLGSCRAICLNRLHRRRGSLDGLLAPGCSTGDPGHGLAGDLPVPVGVE
jgi:ABC-type maltose transport system permease subunit